MRCFIPLAFELLNKNLLIHKITKTSAVIRNNTLKKEVAAKSIEKPITPITAVKMARMSNDLFMT